MSKFKIAILGTLSIPCQLKQVVYWSSYSNRNWISWYKIRILFNVYSEPHPFIYQDLLNQVIGIYIGIDDPLTIVSQIDR